jgi:hypothetical protein
MEKAYVRAVSAVPAYGLSDGWLQLTASREIVGFLRGFTSARGN